MQRDSGGFWVLPGETRQPLKKMLRSYETEGYITASAEKKNNSPTSVRPGSLGSAVCRSTLLTYSGRCSGSLGGAYLYWKAQRGYSKHVCLVAPAYQW